MTYESSVKTRYVAWPNQRLTQGDVISDINFMIGSRSSDDQLIGNDYNRRYVVVMSQDCDLESHNRTIELGARDERAMLETVLVCPAYPLEQFKEGTHQETESIGKLSLSSKELRVNDKHKRYHVLPEDQNLKVTELIIDFKEFYTVPYSVLENARASNYVATVNELFRESLSQRFASYLSRIGLPVLD